MPDVFQTAALTAGPNYVLLTAVLFLVTAASLARLKKLGALDEKARNVSAAAHAENIIHSLLKLALSVVLTAALSRIVISPDYPGGAFAPDWPMLFGGLLLLLFSMPSVAVMILLSKRNRPARHANSAILALAIAVSVAASGLGYVLAAAAANDLSVFQGLRAPILLTASAAAIGAILTAGVIGHFYAVSQLVSAEGIPWKIVSIDGVIASVPTALATFLASIFVLATA